jgi:polysaccharide export outer membrane protein
MRKIFIFLVFALLLTSCISTRRLTYLQEQPGKPVQLDSLGFQPIQQTEYRLQVNDMLNIQIKSFNEDADKFFNLENQNGGNRMMMGGGAQGGGGNPFLYFMGYSLDLNGNVQLPVLGSVHLAGLTVNEAREKINTLLKDYFNDNLVFVKLQISGIRYTVIGEANNVENYIFNNQVNIFQALAAVGGLDVYANRRRVQIFRQYPEGIKMFEIDLTDRNVITNPMYLIQPNDIINVIPLRQKTWGVGEQGVQTILTSIGLITSSLTFYLFLTSLRPNEE